MEPTADSNLIVPKVWVNAIRIPEGYPMEGKLVEPCFCGYPTELEAGYPIALIEMNDGRLVLCHLECVYIEE